MNSCHGVATLISQNVRSGTPCSCERPFAKQFLGQRRCMYIQRNNSRCNSPHKTVQASAFAVGGAATSGLLSMATLTQGLCALGLAYIGFELFGASTSGSEDDEYREPCSSCGGTGLVECFCSRWSDNDAGCGTCGNTGRMVCSSCRGGGTGVPVTQNLYVRVDDGQRRTD